jgi:CIC family chloride channel protein
LVTVLWLRRSILTEKVARRGHHLSREYAVDPFEIHRISEIMLTDYSSVEASTPVSELRNPAFPGFSWFAERRAMPIVDARDRVVGIVTQGDYLRAATMADGLSLSVLEAGTRNLVTIEEDEVVRAAVVKLLRANIERIIVVNPDEPTQAVGFLDRSTVMDAQLRWYEEEHVRERPRRLFAT